MPNSKIDDFQILKFLQGRSTPEEKAEILEWLSLSEENRNAYFQLKALWLAYKDNFYKDEENLEKSLLAYRARISPVNRHARFYNAITRVFSFFIPFRQAAFSARTNRKT